MNTATTTQDNAPPATAKTSSDNVSKISTPLSTQKHNTSSLQIIPISQIATSKTNPRKTFEGPDFDELVESIRVHGVLQPVLVRPSLNFKNHDDGTPGFELVAGERRYRAAVKVGLTALQASVRELTNEQVLEIQIVENLQRRDVTAFEESEGYRQLIEAMAAEQPKATRTELVQTIAQRIGKSVRYVWNRMKLNELIPELQTMLSKGVISASHADELVRLCAKDQQDFIYNHLFYDVADHEGFGDVHLPRSIREVKKLIAEKYQLELSKSGFPLDDARLVAAAGACTSCLKNSANNPTAEADAKKSVCMDRACFASKKAAFVQLQTLKLPDFLASKPVLKVTPQHHLTHGAGKSKDAPLTRKEWKTAHKGECVHVQPAVVFDTNELHEQAMKAVLVCANKKCDVHFGAKPAAAKSGGGLSSGRSVPVETAAEKKAKEERKVENAVRLAIAKKVIEQTTKMPEIAIRQLVAGMLQSYWAWEKGKLLIPSIEADAKKAKIDSPTFAKVVIAGLLAPFLVVGEYNRPSDGRVEFDAAVLNFGIDVEKERKAFAAPKKDLTPEQLASIADPKAPKKSAVKAKTLSSSKAPAASPKSKTTNKAAKKSSPKAAKKSSAKKGGR